MTNEKKDKIKDSIFIWCITLILAIITIITAILYNEDVTNINVSNDNNNIAYHLDSDNNIVSDNLFNIPVSNYGPGFVVRNYYVSLSGVHSFNISSDNNSGGYAIDFWLNNSIVYTINGNVGQTRTYDISWQYDNISIYINQSNTNLKVMVNSGSNGLPYEPYGIWYKNESTFNYMEYYSNAQLIYQNNVVYDTPTLSSGIYWGLSYINTAINMTPELDNIDYCKILFASPINVTSGYVLSAVTFGFDWVLTFYNDDTLVYTLSVSNLVSNDNYRAFYTFENAFTFNNIHINNESMFLEDSILLNLVSSNVGLNYDLGYNEGYGKGYSLGENNGYSRGQTFGYNQGYQVGLNEGVNTDLQSNGMKVLFNSILSFPINFISQSLNFEFMGINVASIVLFLCSVGIVLFVIKRLWK